MGHQTWFGHIEPAREENLRHESMIPRAWRWQDPGLIDQLGKIDAATACPSRIGAGHNDQFVVEEHFRIQVVRQVLSEAATQSAAGRNQIFDPAAPVPAPPLRGRSHRQNAPLRADIAAEKREMICGRMVVESESVHPIRNSPTVGSDRKSISLTLCFNSSKAATLRLSSASP